MKKIFKKFYWVVLDLIFINIAFLFSLIVNFGMDWKVYFKVYWGLFFGLSVSFFLFALIFKLYRRLWRYLSICDLFLIAKVVTGGMFVFVIYFNGLKGIVFPYDVVVLTWFTILALISGSRLVWRLYCERKGIAKKGEDRIKSFWKW